MTDPAHELPEEAVDVDQLLTDVTLYWLTSTGASSAHLYYETRDSRGGRVGPLPPGVDRRRVRDYRVLISVAF